MSRSCAPTWSGTSCGSRRVVRRPPSPRLTINSYPKSYAAILLRPRASYGTQRFVAPVMLGAIGNGGDLQSVPPQAVVKRLASGTEVAYVLWRSRQACRPSSCDGREDTTLGEMDLTTGDIRFVQDYKNQGTMRMPTDEQSPLSMAGDTLFHAHWMLLQSVRITDRSASLGGSYADPIRTREMTPTLNTWPLARVRIETRGIITVLRHVAALR